MSLVRSSDDSLAKILYFLTGEDVLRLMATGSKVLSSRILQNSTDLLFLFDRSTLFPFPAYRFPKLSSLALKTLGKGRSRHLSTVGRSLLLPKPMKSLESLEFEFAASAFLFSHKDLHSAFPNLTSLVVRSKSPYRLVIADNWAKSLPKKNFVVDDRSFCSWLPRRDI